MSRPVTRSRSALKVGMLLPSFLVVAGMIIGALSPISAPAAAAAPTGSVASSGIVKTTLAGFNPGNIISDAVFYNSNTMTAAQMQTFFNSKVSKCQTGYTCLKDFKQDTPTRVGDHYCKGYAGAANESAATILYKTAISCGINPQVLVVMLQKEQGLITHTWPSQWRYDSALGQGCPDTAPCDPYFAGFFYQIYGAARQMKIYAEGRYFQWYKAGKTWNIQFHPNAACGSAPVYIANKATESLYYYTPYQPNAAAMKAGYGTGDACSAYGNRNFYNYFTDWFGSTQATPPPAPAAAPKPILTSFDTSSFVTALDGAGTLWGYPYAKGVWGNRVQMASLGSAMTAAYGVGDLNGDAHRDYVVVTSAGKPSVVLGTGPKSLGQPKALPFDWSAAVLKTPAGDFNGDGLPDFFTTGTDGRLFLYRGNDRGGFASPIVVGTSWNMMSSIIGGSDFNGDGKSDLVARAKTGELYLYPGDGRGGWGTRVSIGNSWQTFSSLMSPGDFDGDGKADILASDAQGSLFLYRGSGTGTLTRVGAVGAGWHVMRSVQPSGSPATTLRPLTNGAGDLNGDRTSDVIALSDNGQMRIYGGDGNGGFSKVSVAASGMSSADRVVPLGDFTGDGLPDVARIAASGAFSLHPGKPGGGFGAARVIGSAWQDFTQVVGGIDFNGDRAMDVIAIDKQGIMKLYPGNGQGGWANAAGAQIGQGWQGFSSVFAAGDFDRNGRADLMAVRASDGALMLYPTTGNGHFAVSRQVGQAWQGFARVFSPGDFTGDGASDVLAITKSGDLMLYPGNGKGGWGAVKKVGTSWNVIVSVG